MAGPERNGKLPPLSGPGPREGGQETEAPPQIKGYRITGPLGEGGMGTVWRAVQVNTRREVALKIVGRGFLSSEKALARFEREVELTARLQHPNIARIYESGQSNGTHYYAMELIEGVPLDEYVTKQGLAQRQILELMGTVCEAVQHAHERGIIHRDLKPSNVLVTADGQPHVLDFGLAKGLLEGDSVLTLSSQGEPAGTPAYMSPEQAAGRSEEVDTRTDVYSLGVVLYRLLTGQSPHDLSGTHYEVLRRIAENEVKRPREVTKDLDPEIEALLLTALAHDPKERYPYAGGLAQDIENYLTGEPLIARPATTMYFLRKRISKYRGRVVLALLVLSVVIGMAVFAYIRIARERNRAVSAEALAKERLGNLQKEADKARASYETLRGIILDSGSPLGRRKDIVEETARDLEKQFPNRPEVRAAVQMVLGQLCLFAGYPDAAETQFRSALEIREGELGEYHLDTVESMGLLAIALGYEGKWGEQEDLTRRMLDVRRKVLGEGHWDTLYSMLVLAGRLLRKREFAEAEKVFSDIVRIQRSEGRVHDFRTVWAMNALACLYRRTGELDKVEELTRETLKAQRIIRGDKHPETLCAMSNLAGILEKRGKLGEANGLREEELEIRRQLRAERRPDEESAPSPSTPPMAFEDFDSELSLDWQIINPDPTHFSLTKTPGALTISTQDGGFTESATDYENLFLLDYPVAAEQDCQMTTCISSFKPVASYNQAGLIFYEDDDNYLKFDYEYHQTAGGRVFNVGVETEGHFRNPCFPANQEFDRVWLRVIKRGNRYELFTSLNGEVFEAELYPCFDPGGIFQDAVAWGDGRVQRVGLFAKNASRAGAPEIDASFDFFEVKVLPPKPRRAEKGISALEEKANEQPE
jgi:hypothetical protein